MIKELVDPLSLMEVWPRDRVSTRYIFEKYSEDYIRKICNEPKKEQHSQLINQVNCNLYTSLTPNMRAKQ